MTGARLRSPLGVLLLACAAQFMVVLDVSVVNVALPSIRAALGFDRAGLPWVVNGYALVFAGFLLLGGRLADLHGRRRMLVLGLVLFSAASLVGGLASTSGLLVAARAAQGLGAAVLAPATLTILTTTFAEGPARTRALAAWTAVGLGGGAAGNLLGGALTQYLSWRWILLINVPIGTIAVVLAVVLLAADEQRRFTQRLDVPGAVLVTTGVTALTFAVTRLETGGWADPLTATAAAVGVGALAAFVAVEARVASAPLIPLHLFRRRALSVGNVAMVLAGAALAPMWYFLSLFMQNVLHYGPLQTGLGFLPHTLVTIVVAAGLTPRLMRRVGARSLIVVGALVAAAGFVWQSRVPPDTGYVTGLLGPAILMSVGSGLLITPITTTVMSGTAPTDAGAASGLMNTTKQVGGALGLAVLVVVAGSAGSSPQLSAAGYGRAFLTIAGILVAVAAVSLALPGNADRGAPQARAGSADGRGHPLDGLGEQRR